MSGYNAQDWMSFVETRRWDKLGYSALEGHNYIVEEIVSYTRELELKIASENWVKYSWGNKDSHPPRPGRYEVYREKCDKIHYQQWNGSGWGSNNNDTSHWRMISPRPEL